jgi:hypothetical protein
MRRPGSGFDFERAHAAEGQVVHERDPTSVVGGARVGPRPEQYRAAPGRFDYLSYFIVGEVADTPSAAPGSLPDDEVMGGRRVGVRVVNIVTVRGLAPGDAVIDFTVPANAHALAVAIASFVTHPLSVVRITGYVDGSEQSPVPGDLGRRRALVTYAVFNSTMPLDRGEVLIRSGGTSAAVSPADRRGVEIQVVEPDI